MGALAVHVAKSREGVIHVLPEEVNGCLLKWAG